MGKWSVEKAVGWSRPGWLIRDREQQPCQIKPTFAEAIVYAHRQATASEAQRRLWEEGRE